MGTNIWYCDRDNTSDRAVLNEDNGDASAPTVGSPALGLGFQPIPVEQIGLIAKR